MITKVDFKMVEIENPVLGGAQAVFLVVRIGGDLHCTRLWRAAQIWYCILEVAILNE